MSKVNPIQPTESELAILQILWTQGPCPVREVNDQLNASRAAGQKEIGYTTTLKIMQLMLDKGLVDRNTAMRTHIYRAAVAENAIRKNLLNRFVDTAFRGSAMDLVMQALGNEDTSQEELNELKAFIKKIEEDRKNS